jgi:hypothetical protein
MRALREPVTLDDSGRVDFDSLSQRMIGRYRTRTV